MKLLCLLLFIGLPVGCARSTSISEGTPVADLIKTRIPDIENLGAPATNRRIRFPLILRCEDIKLNNVRPGTTWREIQIGVTTFEEMVVTLQENGSEINIYWLDTNGLLQISNRSTEIEPYWSLLDACFIGDVLVTLNNRNPIEEEFPKRLPDIVEEYGKPDVVTWGHNYYFRNLIWLDLGLLIVVDLDYDENTSVLLFPPITEEEFEESWLYKILPKSIEGWTDLGVIDEFGRLPSRKEREDPWGYTDWWRIFD